MASKAVRMESKESGDFSYAANVNSFLMKKRNNFLCCVDGSAHGDYTLQTAYSLMKKHDHMTLFHAFKEHIDESKIFPVEYRPKEMKLKYECELIGHLSASRYSIWWTKSQVGGDRKAIEELQHEMRARRHDFDYPDFLLMGHVGRKGKKDTQTTLGSNSDVSLRTMHLPIIIVKQPCPATNRKFMLSVNGSTYSERGLDINLTLINAKDSLILFHFYTPDSEEAITKAHELKTKYEDELDMYGPLDSSFQLIEKEQGKALTHCIADYVNEANPTFLGICPRGKAELSSLSEYVVNNVNCSVIFCKT